MPSFKTVYDKEHLSGDDLVFFEGKKKVFRRLRLTLEKVIMKEMQQSEEMGGGKKPKLLAYFKGKKKYVILNSSNCDSLFAITGTDDYDQWRDFDVILTAHEKDVFKKKRHVIDILPAPKEQPEKTGEAPAPSVAKTEGKAKAKEASPAPSAEPASVDGPVEPTGASVSVDEPDFDEDDDDHHEYTDPEVEA